MDKAVEAYKAALELVYPRPFAWSLREDAFRSGYRAAVAGSSAKVARAEAERDEVLAMRPGALAVRIGEQGVEIEKLRAALAASKAETVSEDVLAAAEAKVDGLAEVYRSIARAVRGKNDPASEEIRHILEAYRRGEEYEPPYPLMDVEGRIISSPVNAQERELVEATLKWAQWSATRRKAQKGRMGELELFVYEYALDLLSSRAAATKGGTG